MRGHTIRASAVRDHGRAGGTASGSQRAEHRPDVGLVVAAPMAPGRSHPHSPRSALDQGCVAHPPRRTVRGRSDGVTLPRMRASLEAHLGSRQVGKVVYGAIIGLALIVAIQGHPPKAGVMAIWLIGTAVAVGLAEVYSEVVGTETSTRHPVSRPEMVHMTEDAAAVGFGVAFPAAFFLLSALGLFEVDTAFSIAKWSGLGLIGFYGYWAAKFAGAATHRALLKGVLVALIGAGLILLKSLVH